LADESAYDYPFWPLEILLTWTRRKSGIPRDDTAGISQHRDYVLREITRRGAANELTLFGRRCRLEFPDQIKISSPSTKPDAIPAIELADAAIWPLLGHYVLTPPASGGLTAAGAAELAELPAGVRDTILQSSALAYPFRWAEPGDCL
jgi:hypothetical protein